MDPDNIMNDLSKEIENSLKALSEASSLEEKLSHSKIVENLCNSLGVFLNLATEMLPFDFEE